ncbi:MAG: lipoprotein-releasing ABC transporter permease subunit [Halieaceae bacterium]|nr:lipoprotein-releasing ABC transporter permease subunit [Halieaceae bacterium]
MNCARGTWKRWNPVMRATEKMRVAARYTLGWRGGYLSSFLSMLSVLGMVLAIALLILVLSVMNGFDREMRDNILALVPQLTLKSWAPVDDWQGFAAQIDAVPGVRASAPFVEVQGMLVRDLAIETTLVQGIDLERQQALPGLQRALEPAELTAFADDPQALLLGAKLAERLSTSAGDTLTLIVPRGAGQSAAFQALRVVGTVSSGTELDEALAVIHLEQAAVLAGTEGGVHGFRVAVDDVFRAPRMGWELVNVLPPGFYATDWTQTHGNLYAAIQMSRDLVILLLFSIIAIAAFNVVSSLVLVVVDKRADIAILRAQGARPADISGIFLRQGLLIALAGTVLGSALGVAASLGVTDLVAGLEHWLGIRFLDTDVYPIGYLPSDLRPGDLVLINGVAVVLCFLAALYPARRAARLPPADALRHE